ncbi:TVP38/TMEM64 family protein [Psychroserpens sp. Hel_I_66]|uniref:TVP38/TMEM64 family protein n=1 Tax=Psychroserpens sp. Hel_I_66 TaxID=1250004 RepID=UPI00064665CA|nr:TVP38/TMEM64 family protein [Psychroserpens sp. Hel_I_66]
MASHSEEKSKTPLIVSIVIVLAVVVSYFTFSNVQDFMDNAWDVLSSGDQKRIENWVVQFGALGPLVLVLSMIIQMFLIVIPSVLLMIVCIVAYGPVWGSLLVLIAIWSASTIGYLIGKHFGQGPVAKIIGQQTEDKITDFLKDYGFWAIAITRINPFLSNDAISFVAGALKMNYLKFISATLLGIAPLTLYLAIIGENTQSLKTGLLYGSIVSLVVFLAYVYWDKKLRKKHNN